MFNYLLWGGLAYMLYQRRETLAKFLPQSVNDKISGAFADKARLVIQLQTFILMLTGLYFIPFDYFLPGGIQAWCYTLSMWMAMFSSGVTIITNYDWPPVKNGWQACQPYLATVSQSTEFHFFFYAIIWMNTPPFFLVLLVPGRRALWSVMM